MGVRPHSRKIFSNKDVRLGKGSIREGIWRSDGRAIAAFVKPGGDAKDVVPLALARSEDGGGRWQAAERAEAVDEGFGA